MVAKYCLFVFDIFEVNKNLCKKRHDKIDFDVRYLYGINKHFIVVRAYVNNVCSANRSRDLASEHLTNLHVVHHTEIWIVVFILMLLIYVSSYEENFNITMYLITC